MTLRTLLPALTLLLLVPALAPAAQASGHCVVETRPRDFVCYGPMWCDTQSGICGTPVCVDETMSVCVLEAPDGSPPSNCVVQPKPDIGFVCFGQEWCSDWMCARPICLTNEGVVCVMESP